MAVAGKAGVQRDGREIVAAVENGIQGMRQPLMQDIIVDGSADRLAKHVTEMKGRHISDIGKLGDAPFPRARYYAAFSTSGML